jgi:hypothetical protein
MRNPKVRWGVAVGLPKMEYWNKAGKTPPLDATGTWCLGKIERHLVFDTRQQAEKEARDSTDCVDAWTYVAKKYTPNRKAIIK